MSLSTLEENVIQIISFVFRKRPEKNKLDNKLNSNT